MTNHELIQGFLNHDKKIISECYQQAHYTISNLLRKHSATSEDIKEVVQYCMTVFFQYCQKENFELTSQFSTLIYSIAYRKWMKELKRRKKNSRLSDFIEKKQQTINEKLCKVRSVFDKFNLISGLHSFMSDSDKIYQNVLPPVSLLDEKDKQNQEELTKK